MASKRFRPLNRTGNAYRSSLVMPLFNIAVLDLLVTVMALEKFSFFKAYLVKRCRSKPAESSNSINLSNGNDKVAERMLEAQNRLDEHIEGQWAEFCNYLQNPDDNSEAFERRVSQHLENLEVLQKLQDRFSAFEEEEEEEEEDS
ncbi:MAG: hypothetical protein LQ344_003766 [Seirophora lacunosa]|nr:MAG: hypothetical protein LQ344_003766 [Seirophora lacunosa]